MTDDSNNRIRKIALVSVIVIVFAIGVGLILAISPEGLNINDANILNEEDHDCLTGIQIVENNIDNRGEPLEITVAPGSYGQFTFRDETQRWGPNDDKIEIAVTGEGIYYGTLRCGEADPAEVAITVSE